MSSAAITASGAARELILSGKAPEGMVVRGPIDLAEKRLKFPLPARLEATYVNLTNCPFEQLPSGWRCGELNLTGTLIESLPADLVVRHKLVLRNCTYLAELPANLALGSLDLSGCVGLKALPEGLDVWFLNLEGCTRLRGWPNVMSVKIGRLNMRGCSELRSLPPTLGRLTSLDVSGCRELQTLPDGLQIALWLDLANTAIRKLPASLEQTPLRWRGVPIDHRIAFRPETITLEEIKGEGNAERRRVLLERFGYERFIEAAEAELIHQDRDPGGERRLLRVPMDDDEPLVCLSCYCPSTGRRYFLRVPPAMQDCHQAAAWIAGFDDPDLYAPLVET